MRLVYVLILLSAFISVSSLAGDLVVDGKITKVGSTNWNERVFYIIIEGGSGPCANKAINFPEEFSQSTVAYAQAHSMAMMAFIHNKKVRVYNYGNKTFKNNDICTGANFIDIYN